MEGWLWISIYTYKVNKWVDKVDGCVDACIYMDGWIDEWMDGSYIIDILWSFEYTTTCRCQSALNFNQEV